ncbi:alpha/beta hydrolase [Clostridium sp. P21]|uniref:Alpha/beta hydrolase n=1 Tax=Clostridium muellerianum TaxID=2716538 RepID=A0A7Y0EKR5_9CLOT|nr:alpha/beta hydrolase [Clostridium muellerianum]NMM65289.1 alpha/beta hydrolase [Clostridium muellerianum]
MYEVSNMKSETTKIKVKVKIKSSKIREMIVISLIFIFTIINLSGFWIGNFIYTEACQNQTSKGVSNLHEIYKNTFDDNRFLKLSKDEVTIDSPYGYKLSGTYIHNPTKTENTVIIVHGIRGSRWESLKYADIYLNKGYNALVYDSRFSGESGGHDISFGFYEKYDLNQWIKWVHDKNPKGILGVHGESMGGATVLLHSKLNEKNHMVKFYVSDCAYSNLGDLLIFRLKKDYGIKNRFLASTIVNYTNIITYVRSGFTFSEVSPINSIKDAKTPILFVHGDSDSFIPFSMSNDMYYIKPGKKSIYIAPYSGHAQSYLYNKKDYTQKVYDFIDKNVK